jgi:hypothetical protein
MTKGVSYKKVRRTKGGGMMIGGFGMTKGEGDKMGIV